MTWRAIIISRPSYLSMVQEKIMLIRQGEDELRLPLEDIAVIVIEHAQVTLTANLMSACGTYGVPVIFPDAKHIPRATLLPYCTHSRMLKIVQAQVAISLPTQKRLWQRIIRQKIINQSAVMHSAGKATAARRIRIIARAVRSGDPNNREAVAARYYFSRLFGKGFIRRDDHLINANLNYGYAIIRAMIARTLASYGFVCALGIFHRSETNPFNLADDLLEAYRPIVDMDVYSRTGNEPDRSLAREDKAALLALTGKNFQFESKSRGVFESTLPAAIDMMASSLSSIIVNEADVDELILPRLDS